MSDDNKDSSDTSESEVSVCSSTYNPLKALYSSKSKVPIENAPKYENIQQFESAMSGFEVSKVGSKELFRKREKEKEAKLKAQKELEEKNRQRFSHLQGAGLTTVQRREWKQRNVLTRMPTLEGPLAALKVCVDRSIRIKIVTRHATGIRGELYGTLAAFDKQWNLALTDVLEVWRRKAPNKRKIPPAMGVPVSRGTAAKISPVPVVTECSLGRGLFECTRHVPQLLVRGEHVVYINIVETWSRPHSATVDERASKTQGDRSKLGGVALETFGVSTTTSGVSATTSGDSSKTSGVSATTSRVSSKTSELGAITSELDAITSELGAITSGVSSETSGVSAISSGVNFRMGEGSLSSVRWKTCVDETQPSGSGLRANVHSPKS